MTEKIIKSLTAFVNEYIKEYPFLHSLIVKSKGITLPHMVRTFALAYRFILHFNSEVVTNSFVSHLRGRFNDSFRSWYSSLLPHVSQENLTLEHIFKGGMRPVPENDLNIYSVGFLFHDIGKQRDIDYYEGDDGFDKLKVESHVKTGYSMLMEKTGYSEQIAAIAGYHHEYYGHESGYGYYRELCALMTQEKNDFRQDSCISYDLKDLYNFNTLSYLPEKFLEIVDVYDAITDPGRSYKYPLDTSEALQFMREEFIINNKKIDLILFELFVHFIKDD